MIFSTLSPFSSDITLRCYCVFNTFSAHSAIFQVDTVARIYAILSAHCSFLLGSRGIILRPRRVRVRSLTGSRVTSVMPTVGNCPTIIIIFIIISLLYTEALLF